MIIRDALEKRLFDNGMFEGDARAVLYAAMAAPENQAMEGRWTESVDAYPPQLLAVLWVSVQAHAVRWIDEHQPQAWYRAVFADAVTCADAVVSVVSPEPKTDS